VARARPGARRVVRGDRPAVALLVRPAERRSSLEVLALLVKVGRITVLAPARTGLLLRSGLAGSLLVVGLLGDRFGESVRRCCRDARRDSTGDSGARPSGHSARDASADSPRDPLP